MAERLLIYRQGWVGALAISLTLIPQGGRGIGKSATFDIEAGASRGMFLLESGEYYYDFPKNMLSRAKRGTGVAWAAPTTHFREEA